MMLHAIKNFRNYPPPTWFPRPLPSNLGRKTSSALGFSTHPDSARDIDKTQNQSEMAAGDVMSNSFAEGYATRSDEEGFCKVNGGNQSTSNIEMDKLIHENHPAYDKTQIREAKEKAEAPN